MTPDDQALFERGLAYVNSLTDALTVFQCAAEMAGRGSIEARELADIARHKLEDLLDDRRRSTV